jgi:oligosaccharide repeat unit polymerase
MKRKQIYLLVLFLGVYIAVRILTPGALEISFLVNILLLLPILSIFLFIYNRKTQGTQRFSMGVVFLFIMFAFMVIGGINYFITCYIYPGYYGGLEVTNLYWTICIISFAIGYLATVRSNKKIRPTRTLYAMNLKTLAIIFAILGLIGSMVSIFRVGYIPILSGESMSGVRFSNIMGEYAKLWKMNILAAISAFRVMLQKKEKRTLYFLIFLSASIQLTFFVVRFDVFLVMIACLLLYLYTKQINKKRVISLIIIAISLIAFNGFYLTIRERSLNPVQASPDLSFVQRRIIYSTFNEYRQLNVLMRNYNDDYLWGKSFLNIPISFLPYEVWQLFGIDKARIQSINSAVILRDIEEASGGLRSGIGGELFINFGFWGSLLMSLFGIFIAYMDNVLNALDKRDVRIPFILLFQSILIYAIIGQINAISSTFSFLFYSMLVVMIFSKKKYYTNQCNNFYVSKV